MPQTPKTISSFPAASAPADTDLLLIETTPPAYQKATMATLLGYVQQSGHLLRYDTAQSLSTGQLAQALSNLGITLTNDGLQVLCPDGQTRTLPFLN